MKRNFSTLKNSNESGISKKKKILHSTISASVVASVVVPINAISAEAADDAFPSAPESPNSAALTQPTFPDVPKDAFFHDAVIELTKKGTVSGYPDGTFKPANQVIRAEAAAMLAKDLALKNKASTDQAENNNPTHFKDITQTDWFYDAVTTLSQKGIIGGYEDGSFKPNQTVTRAELTKLLVSAYNLSSNQSHKEIPFQDVPTDSWYLEPLQTLIDHSLVSGKTSTQFGPNDPVNRGEIATFIARINEFIKTPAQQQTQKIEAVTDETVIINGTTYQIDDKIKGILNSKNATALENAELSFEKNNNTITKITALTIKASGQSATKGQQEFSKNITFDAAGNTIDGDLTIDGNFITIKNAVISGDLEITPNLKNDFYSDNLTVRGETRVNGGDDNTVVFKDSSLQKIHVSKQNVHIKAEGKTTTDQITLSSNSIVTADKGVKIPSIKIADGANQVELNTQIQDLFITNEKESKLTGGTNIDRLTIDSPTKLKLDIKGTIKVLKVTDKNARITLGKDVTVEKYELPDGVKIEDIVKKYNSYSSGGGGGSSDDDDDDDSSNPDPDPGETQTHAPSLSNISIVNNRSTEDTLTIKNVALNSTIRIYSSATDDRVIKSATTDNTTATIPGLDLGTESGSIWVSVQNPGKTESTRTKVDYASEIAGASGIAINKSNFTLAPGASEALTAALNLPDVTPSEVTFTWESLDEDIATVTNTGVVTAHEPGKVLIKVSATLPNSTTISATSELTVYEEVEIELFEGSGVILGPPTPAPLKVKGTVKLEDTPDAKEVNVSIGLPEVPADAKLTVSKLPEDIPTPPKDAPFIAMDIAVEGYRAGEQFRIEMDIPEGLNEDSPGAYHYNSDTGIWEYREGKIENGKFVFMTDLSPISIWKRVPAPKHATITVTEDNKYKLSWVGTVEDTYYKVFDGDKVLNPRIEASEFELPPLADGMHYLYVRAYRVGNPDSPLPIKATFESAISNVVPLRIGGEDETIYISHFALNSANLALNVGDTETIFTAIDPYNATEPLVWASTNPYVASVDQQGVVHAKAPGTTTINVFPLNNPSAVQRVNVVVKGGDNVSVTPEEQELTLAAGERSNAIPVETIFNPQAKVDKLDVVFAFDTTGSMGGAIDTAKENAIDIMNLVRSRISDAQFGVISFEDYAGYMSPDSGYGDTYGGENDDPYILNQIVTDNPTLVQNAINQLYADDGYDWPESYTRALYELSDPTPRVDYVRWRTDAKKIIVLFGDAPTHDLDFAGENYGEDPGRDGIGGTADDLRFVEVVDSLREQGIIVLAVDSYLGDNATLQGMSIGYLPEDGETWQGTEGTNGKYVSLNDASLPVIINSFVTEHAKKISSIKIAAPEPYKDWIETDPKELRNVEMPTDEPITNHFNLYVKPPKGTAAGDYQFKATVNADGVELGTILLKIKVGEAIIARPTPNITTSVVPKGAKIKLTAQAGDVIHYTLDGSTPTTESPVLASDNVITINENTTVKAIAVRKNEDGIVNTSDLMSMDYKILTIAAPTANPNTEYIRRGTKIELSTNVPGARIYYTTDGSEPTVSDTIYRTPIEINYATPIKAIAVVKTKIDGEEYVTTSDIATFNYSISELSAYDYLNTFRVGSINLLTLEYMIQDKLVVHDPDIEPGLVVPVTDFSNFAGIIASSDPLIKSLVVKVNGVVVPEEELATKAISPGDTIVVSVTAQDGLSTRHYKVTFIEEAPPVIPLMEMEKVELAPIPGENPEAETSPIDGLEPGSGAESGDIPEDGLGSEETPVDEGESNDTPGGETDSGAIPGGGTVSKPEADSKPTSETTPEAAVTPDSPSEGGTGAEVNFETAPSGVSDSNSTPPITFNLKNKNTNYALFFAPPIDVINTTDNLTLNADGTIGTSNTRSIFAYNFSPSYTTAKTISLRSTLAKQEIPTIIRLTGIKWEI